MTMMNVTTALLPIQLLMVEFQVNGLYCLTSNY